MKLNKLVLKKETISVLNDYSLSRIKGGDGWTTWDKINEYLAGTLSHYDVANCINGYAGSGDSYCVCNGTGNGNLTKNGGNTCNSCETCNGNTCITCNGNTCQNCA
jgi:hypothetical protein